MMRVAIGLSMLSFTLALGMSHPAGAQVETQVEPQVETRELNLAENNDRRLALGTRPGGLTGARVGFGAGRTEHPPQQVEPVSSLVLAGGTFLGGLVGAAAGFGIAWAVPLATTDPLAITFTTWATPASTALGIWLGGRAAGGQGRYDLTLLGSAIGGSLGAGIAMAGAAGSDTALIAGLVAVPVFEWIGGAIAYHRSHDANLERHERHMGSFVPAVSVERGGASLRLNGAF